MNKNRLEAFSDGVFAIVMTLLVIEIKVPHLKQFSEAGLLHGLEELLPLFFAFFLSFSTLSYVWFAHNFLFTIMAQNVTRKLMNANFIFLAFVSLVPFSSALLGEYSQSKTAVFVYSLNIALIGICNYVIREYIYRSVDIKLPDLVKLNFTDLDTFYGTVRMAIAVFGSLLAVLLSFLVDTRISIGLLVLQSIVLVTPGAVGLLVKVFKLEGLKPVLKQVDNVIERVVGDDGNTPKKS